SIDTQTFNLKEHRIVSRIGSVASKHSSGRNHSNQDAAPLHRVYLDGGRLRTKREPVSGVERVLPRACRVIQRDIERIEIVEIRFDLAIVLDGISESDEDVFQTLAQQRDRMSMPRARTPARHGHVDT